MGASSHTFFDGTHLKHKNKFFKILLKLHFLKTIFNTTFLYGSEYNLIIGHLFQKHCIQLKLVNSGNVFPRIPRERIKQLQDFCPSAIRKVQFKK